MATATVEPTLAQNDDMVDADFLFGAAIYLANHGFTFSEIIATLECELEVDRLEAVESTLSLAKVLEDASS